MSKAWPLQPACLPRLCACRSLLFGVFDGHGPRGRDVSQVVKQRLAELLMDQGDALARDTQVAFADAFAGMQSELLAQGGCRWQAWGVLVPRHKDSQIAARFLLCDWPDLI